MAFGRFLKSTGLLDKLRACGIQPDSCRPFCAGYNGTAYANNNYHLKLASAIKAFGGT